MHGHDNGHAIFAINFRYKLEELRISGVWFEQGKPTCYVTNKRDHIVETKTREIYCTLENTRHIFTPK